MADYRDYPLFPETENDWLSGIYARLSSDPNQRFKAHVAEVFAEAQDLLLTKHRDYGPKNIAEAPGGPMNGLRVRMWDKMARLNHLWDSGDDPAVVDEAIEDTLMDLANYALIGALVLRQQWPGTEDSPSE
jgi:Nucleotide modification associated domain 1